MATDLRADLGVSPSTRGWLLGIGAIAVVLGIVGLYITFAFMVVGIVWYGVLLIVAGVVQTTEAVAVSTSGDGRRSRFLRLALGLIYIMAGLYVALQPAGAGVALTIVLGLLLVASGAVRAAWILVRQGRWSLGLGLVLAGVSAALGVSLISQWPISGLWVIGLFVSADLVAYGLSWCWAAYAESRRSLNA